MKKLVLSLLFLAGVFAFIGCSSAPKITATFNTSKLLAGINSSGCLAISYSSLAFVLSATPSPNGMMDVSNNL